MIVRPGPDRIDPGACPGGVVIDVYAVPSGVHVVRQLLGPDTDTDDTDAAAALAARLSAGAPGVVLVGYDGDTGARYPISAWLDEGGDP